MAKLILPIQNGAVFNLVWMQKRPKISQRFGNSYGGVYERLGYAMGHPGIDLAIPIGTPIFSSLRGSVKLTPKGKGYGVGCYIRGNGLEVLVNHLSEIYVKDGERVKEGDIIGLSGNTGNSSGPHLHLGFRKYFKGQQYNEGWLDPLPHMICWKGTLENNTLE